MRLAFVTGNPGKLREAGQVLGDSFLLEQDPDGYPEIQADRLEDVARAGLEFVAKRRAPPFFLEDSGLFVDQLDGFPGVYSAYAYRTIGCAGVLKLIQDVPDEKRTARFQAVVAYRDKEGHDHLLSGTCDGWIRHQQSGSGGFGFDPVFVPAAIADGPGGPSFAMVPPEEKNRVSHRGAALRALRDHLATTT